MLVGVEVLVDVGVGVAVLVGVGVDVEVFVGVGVIVGVLVGVASVSWMVHCPCGHRMSSACRVATPGTPAR